MRAAGELHISQPSLSAAIKSLEDDFGVTLFRRGHHGMTLTPEGETLYKMGGELLKRADEVEGIMNDLGGESRILRLGVPPMIGSLILPKLFGEFCEANPEIRLEITEGGRHELLTKLTEGFVDAVFLPHRGQIDSELSSVEAGRLEIVCCAALGDAISKRKVISVSELEGVPLVLFENSFFQTGEIKSRFLSSGASPNILLQTGQLSTVISLISSGIAVGFMFRDLAGTNANIVPIPLDEPLYTNVSLAWKRSSHQKSSMNCFREYIKSTDIFAR